MTEGVSVRSYGCTYGCGNPYDYVIVDIRSSDALMLCVPCFVKTAGDMIETLLNPDSPEAQQAAEAMKLGAQTPMSGPGVKPRGRNAPATIDEPSIIDAYDDVVTAADLPPEFR